MNSKILLSLALLSAPAFAGDNTLPFSFQVVGTETDGSEWSVVNVSLQNASESYIQKIDLYCQLRNDEGYTWTGEATIRSLNPGDRRDVRVAAEGDTQYWKDPTSAQCVVLGFERFYTFP